MVIAFLVALFIPEKPPLPPGDDKQQPEAKDSLSSLAGVHINTPLPGSDEEAPPATSDEDFEPLLHDRIV